MNSVFEKITLYDFFGYLIPGITLETMICIVWLLSEYVSTGADILASLPEINGYVYATYFLTGYVFGTIISEIARWLYDGADALLGFLYNKAENRRRKCNRNCSICEGKSENTKEDSVLLPFFVKVNRATKIEDAVIWNALVKSGIVDKSETMPDPDSGKSLIESYFRLMFSNIQADEKYRRIHDYASYATMCKNLSFTFILSGMFSAARLYAVSGRAAAAAAAAVFLAVSLVMAVRYGRFELKKGIYTIAWFVAKNNEKEENDSEDEKRRKKGY